MNAVPPGTSPPMAPSETATELIRRAFRESESVRRARSISADALLETLLAVLLAASTFLGSIPALYAYRVPGAPAVVLAAACGSTLITFIAARILRLPASASYLLSALGLVLLFLVADGPHVHPIAEALRHGPNRILTETLPLSGGRATISALVVLVWVCGATTSESLIRTAARPGTMPVALVLPIGLYLTCYAVSSSAPGRDRIGGPLLLVTVAAVAAIRLQLTSSAEIDPDADVRPPSHFRASMTGVAAAAVVAVLLATLAPTIPSLRHHPSSLRRQPPTVFPVITDPVDAMGQLRDANPHASPVNELAVSLSASSTGYLAMADLDDYDGGQWRFTATFHPTGGRVPATVAPRVVSSQPVTQRITITGSLPVPLLPALDRPQTVSRLAVVTDPTTGMLLPEGSAPRSTYSVASAAPVQTLAGLPPADGIDATQSAGDVAIPPDTAGDLATAVRFLSTLTGGVRPAPSLAYLQTVVKTLQAQEKRIDPTAPSSSATSNPSAGQQGTPTTLAPTASEGTSLSGVINAITVNRAATPEQFATFFAMVARYLGVPARMVTGFRVARDSVGTPIPAGTYQVTNRQAWAWVEIPVAGIGWVVCDPTPDVATAEVTPPLESVSAPATTVPPLQANAVPKSAIAGGHPLAPPGHITVPRFHSQSPLLVASLAVSGLVLLLLLAGPGQVAGRRAWRRRCRRSEDPERLAVGAWLELLDGLDQAGMHPVPGATANEVARDVGHHFGSDYARRAAAVAAVADRAVFSPSSPVPAEAATQAWDTSRDLRRAVLSSLDTRQRLRSSLVVGSAPVRPSGSGR